jgi:hypothetical protein
MDASGALDLLAHPQDGQRNRQQDGRKHEPRPPVTPLGPGVRQVARIVCHSKTAGCRLSGATDNMILVAARRRMFTLHALGWGAFAGAHEIVGGEWLGAQFGARVLGGRQESGTSHPLARRY